MAPKNWKRGRRSVLIQAVFAVTVLAVFSSIVLLWQAPSWRGRLAVIALAVPIFATIFDIRRLGGRRPPGQERGKPDADHAVLDAAIAQADEAIVITNRKGRIRYVNPAFTRMTGYTSEEALGRNPSVLKSNRQDPAFYRCLWETISAGQVWRGELVNRRKDGSHYTEEMSITPVRDTHGEITDYIAIKQDVTERKMGENAQRLLAAIVESSEDAIFTHTPAGDVVTWNRGAEALFQYPQDEVLGKSVALFIPPEHQFDLPK